MLISSQKKDRDIPSSQLCGRWKLKYRCNQNPANEIKLNFTLALAKFHPNEFSQNTGCFAHSNGKTTVE